MSDKLELRGTGRIVKEPTLTDKGSVIVEIASNLYQKSEDPKNNTHPMWVRCIVSGNLGKFLATKLGNLKGARVWFGGEFNFNTYKKQDGSSGTGYTVFASFFEVHSNKSPVNEPAAAASNAEQKPDDDLPF
jgi:single-stranded DNA-binding protein